ncbi:hypothetical protein CsSME_00020022 [Camellia sinensis var. sinensis]
MAAEVLKKLVAIAPTHCCLLITELLHIFGEAEKELLTTISSGGAAILRVLQALSSLVASISEKDKDHQTLSEKEYTAAISLVYDIGAALEPFRKLFRFATRFIK